MRIAVVGAGAMGSLFGGLLAESGEDVTLVNRGSAHVDAVNAAGLTVVDETAGKGEPADRTVEVPATTEAAAVGEVDLLVLFVKSYATAAAMAAAEPLIGPDTLALTLQNGLGNAETVAETVPESNVLAGATTHGAVREAPGRVRHTGTGDTAFGRYFGGERNDGGESEERLAAVARAFTAAGIDAEVAADARTLVWEKVLVNVGINAPTALARVENGALAESVAGRDVMGRAVREAERVARERGHDVREDAVEYTQSVAERTAPNRSSMLQDVEAGRRSEVAALYGEVVARGADVGVRTPVCRTLRDLVRVATGE
jgi:2-dehydropantoate 2-reductase